MICRTVIRDALAAEIKEGSAWYYLSP